MTIIKREVLDVNVLLLKLSQMCILALPIAITRTYDILSTKKLMILLKFSRINHRLNSYMLKNINISFEIV